MVVLSHVEEGRRSRGAGQEGDGIARLGCSNSPNGREVKLTIVDEIGNEGMRQL